MLTRVLHRCKLMSHHETIENVCYLKLQFYHISAVFHEDENVFFFQVLDIDSVGTNSWKDTKNPNNIKPGSLIRLGPVYHSPVVTEVRISKSITLSYTTRPPSQLSSRKQDKGRKCDTHGSPSRRQDTVCVFFFRPVSTRATATSRKQDTVFVSFFLPFSPPSSFLIQLLVKTENIFFPFFDLCPHVRHDSFRSL